MPTTRFPASAGQYHGELRVSGAGLEFVPVTTFDGLQMCLGLDGWRLPWAEVAGIERVEARRGVVPGESGGLVRVHYDSCARFVSVVVHGSLREFFDAADAGAAVAEPMRAVA
jgi:hypothetical protein